MFGHDPVNNKHHTGRDQHAETTAGSNGAGGQFHGVVVAFHLRQGNGSHGCSGCRRGAADCAKGGTGTNRCHRQATGSVADESVGGIVETPADAGVERYLSHKNKERNNCQAVRAEGRKDIPGQQR